MARAAELRSLGGGEIDGSSSTTTSRALSLLIFQTLRSSSLALFCPTIRYQFGTPRALERSSRHEVIHELHSPTENKNARERFLTFVRNDNACHLERSERSFFNPIFEGAMVTLGQIKVVIQDKTNQQSTDK